jgi:TrmH family RNA methyltransferase
VLLENLQDPGNMGTIIRTADAAAFDGIICTKGCVDVYNSKVLRSTTGSVFQIPIVQFLRGDTVSSSELAKALQKEGYTVYAAHPRGETSCFDEPFLGKSVIVIGNEANGVSDEMLSCCDKLLTIPMPGNAESLNASVAAALMIYEKRRKNP